MIRLAGLGLALLLAAPVYAQPTPSTDQDTPWAARVYAIVYRAGPAWREGEAMHRQALAPHARYIRGLSQQGRVYSAGPWGDRGGLAIISAASIEDARRIVAEDPAVTAGIFTAEVQGFDPRFTNSQPVPIRSD